MELTILFVIVFMLIFSVKDLLSVLLVQPFLLSYLVIYIFYYIFCFCIFKPFHFFITLIPGQLFSGILTAVALYLPYGFVK